MRTSSSPITQVSHTLQTTQDQVKELPSKLQLRLRGTQFEVERELFVCLPESLLLVMFPRGISLEHNEEDDDGAVNGILQVTTEFDPECFAFVLQYFRKARTHFISEHGEFAEEVYLANAAAQASTGTPVHPGHFLLLTRQAILVLREELDYFVVPQEPARVNQQEQISHLKCSSGRHLIGQDLVLDALLKSIDRDSNVAERRLVEILCDAGFSKEDRWAYRALEPKRTSIISIALVSLRTAGGYEDDEQFITAQKLMLFWRKPARKCWWDGTSNVLDGTRVKLWARRTWTLELALV